MAAMIFRLPPQLEQRSMFTKTRFSYAQLIRASLSCA
jgi:hypothetical protein